MWAELEACFSRPGDVWHLGRRRLLRRLDLSGDL